MGQTTKISVAPPARPQKEGSFSGEPTRRLRNHKRPGRDGTTLACEPPVDRREWHEYQGTDKSIYRNAVQCRMSWAHQHTDH
ncbi:hypothetical protein AcW1_003203 [Taiwanofungus camphoratus]|nr:hypothetical protein AcW1_003203 [Antrodia cinnamomea]